MAGLLRFTTWSTKWVKVPQYPAIPISGRRYKSQKLLPANKKLHPLQGIRVLDLTRIVAGPFCTMMLADLGAEVLKIERPYTGGDESRKCGPPFYKATQDSTYFMASNRNKKSVCIDLKKGSDIIHELAAKSDILVENYIPGKLDELKLGYDQLSSVNPGLIYCSITGYGTEGPYAKRAGYDVIAASIGGLLHITGERDGSPCKVGVAVTDIATGLYAHGAILAALLQRYSTQRGQWINVNLLSTQISMLINVASNYLNSGIGAERWGTAHNSIVPYQSFETADGYITLGTGSDQQFRELCRLLNQEHLADNPKYKSNKERVKNRNNLLQIFTDIFKADTSQNWMRLLSNSTFPVGPINTIPEVFADPHVQFINLVKSLPHPAGGHVKVVGPPVVYSDSRNDARTAPPILGQHTDEVLTTILGYKQGKLIKLRKDKIIQ